MHSQSYSTAFPCKGIIPPLVTPLADRDHLDIDGLERLVEHVLAGGVHGLFILGTTGEGPSLGHRLQREMVEQTCRLVQGRVPVLVGVTDSAYVESLNIARFAAEQGADAVVLAAPYYFPIHQADLERYVVTLAREMPLPTFLYNMPSHTKVTFDLETVRHLLDEPNIVGMKDSSGNMHYFNQLLELAKQRAGYAVLVGPEELLAEAVLMGADGGVSGGANLQPRLYVEMYEAALTGDLLLVHKLQQRILLTSSKVYTVGPAPTGYLTGLKTSLNLLGLCSDYLAEPLHGLGADQRARLSRHLTDLGLLVEEHVRS